MPQILEKLNFKKKPVLLLVKSPKIFKERFDYLRKKPVFLEVKSRTDFENERRVTTYLSVVEEEAQHCRQAPEPAATGREGATVRLRPQKARWTLARP